MTTEQKDYQKICELSRKAKVLEGVSNLLNWDQETYMPKKAAPIRAEQIQTLAGIIHKEQTGKTFANALSKLVNLKTGKVTGKGLKPEQKAALKKWHRDYKMQTSLPTSFVEKFARVTSEAQVVWDQAKKQNNFTLFLPTLEEVIDLNKQKAEYFGYTDHPYDALLDIYEPEMTTKEVGKVFTQLKKTIVDLLTEIRKKKQIDDSELTTRFSPNQQLSFGHKLASMIDYNDEKGRIDLSSHPFCTVSHPTDCRITTRIIPNMPISIIRTVLHECGHAFYEHGLSEEHFGTPLGESISLGVHESQSRWWETRIGQSKAFWKFLLPKMKSHFKGKLEGVGLEKMWRGVNKVQPSMIRVEADEVTYALHVILRFELEKALIEGSLSPHDLPAAWNHKMDELLGITPKTDTEGCLQDIHWSMGAFGYFPTYALGNLYAAQLFEPFAEEYPDWEQRVEKGEFAFIKEWLTDHVHLHGRRYNSRELLKKVSGKAFSAEPFEKYLTSKYAEVYKL